MAIASIREFDVGDDRATPNYDAVSAKLGIDDDPPSGLITHTAGFTGDGKFRIFDVWESVEDRDRFESERLMPAMQQANPDAGPPDRSEEYELHHLVTGG